MPPDRAERIRLPRLPPGAASSVLERRSSSGLTTPGSCDVTGPSHGSVADPNAGNDREQRLDPGALTSFAAFPIVAVGERGSSSAPAAARSLVIEVSFLGIGVRIFGPRVYNHESIRPFQGTCFQRRAHEWIGHSGGCSRRTGEGLGDGVGGRATRAPGRDDRGRSPCTARAGARRCCRRTIGRAGGVAEAAAPPPVVHPRARGAFVASIP